jgi:hypothetical protein
VRRSRTIVELAFPIAGATIVFAAVLFLWQDLRVQVAVVLLGLLVLEAGTWKLTRPILPDDRRYLRLRAEVDRFIVLVRRLNAVAENRASHADADVEFEAVRRELIEAVDRISEQAGVVAPAGASDVTGAEPAHPAESTRG